MEQRRFNLFAMTGSLCLVTGLMAATSVYAEEDRFTFNGFGNQDYRRSTANSYLGADSSGTWDNNFLGLVMSAKINDKARVWAQLQATSQANAISSTGFTWMFVDYQFSDNVSAHAGRIKFPFGLYNETIYTQALHPSISEPVVYARAADMTYDAYHGVGVDWRTGPAGSLLVQVFGGNIYTTKVENASRDDNVIGGRVTYNTPVEGLRLMVSANKTTVEAKNGAAPGTPTGEKGAEDRAMLSFDYVAHDLDIKAEYNWHKTPALSTASTPQSIKKSRAYYVQAAYELEKFTPFVRYDYVNTDTNKASDPSEYQKTYVVGVSYKLADNLNLRAEQDFNRGDALGNAEMAFTKVKWNTTMISMNFMF